MNRHKLLLPLLVVAALALIVAGAAAALNRVAPADVRDLAGPAMEAAMADGDHFGGAYINPAHTLAYILYVGDEQSAKARIGGLLPDVVPVEWQKVKYSYAYLDGIWNTLVDKANAGQLDLTRVSVDVPNNQVEVGVAVENRALANSLAEQYGDAVVVRVIPPDKPMEDM